MDAKAAPKAGKYTVKVLKAEEELKVAEVEFLKENKVESLKIKTTELLAAKDQKVEVVGIDSYGEEDTSKTITITATDAKGEALTYGAEGFDLGDHADTEIKVIAYVLGEENLKVEGTIAVKGQAVVDKISLGETIILDAKDKELDEAISGQFEAIYIELNAEDQYGKAIETTLVGDTTIKPTEGKVVFEKLLDAEKEANYIKIEGTNYATLDKDKEVKVKAALTKAGQAPQYTEEVKVTVKKAAVASDFEIVKKEEVIDAKSTVELKVVDQYGNPIKTETENIVVTELANKEDDKVLTIDNITIGEEGKATFDLTPENGKTGTAKLKIELTNGKTEGAEKEVLATKRMEVKVIAATNSLGFEELEADAKELKAGDKLTVKLIASTADKFNAEKVNKDLNKTYKNVKFDLGDNLFLYQDVVFEKGIATIELELTSTEMNQVALANNAIETGLPTSEGIKIESLEVKAGEAAKLAAERAEESVTLKLTDKFGNKVEKEGLTEVKYELPEGVKITEAAADGKVLVEFGKADTKITLSEAKAGDYKFTVDGFDASFTVKEAKPEA